MIYFSIYHSVKKDALSLPPPVICQFWRRMQLTIYAGRGTEKRVWVQILLWMSFCALFGQTCKVWHPGLLICRYHPRPPPIFKGRGRPIPDQNTFTWPWRLHQLDQLYNTCKLHILLLACRLAEIKTSLSLTFTLQTCVSLFVKR